MNFIIVLKLKTERYQEKAHGFGSFVDLPISLLIFQALPSLKVIVIGQVS